MRRTLKLIAAQSLNGVIGREGRIPWRLSTDMAFFRRTTLGHTVLMGRKTYESIGKPLHNRRNLVLTQDPSFAAEGVEVVANARRVLERYAVDGDARGRADQVFVIGGGQVYETFLPHADTVYLTVVEAVVTGDAFFPRLQGDWDVTLLESYEEPDRPLDQAEPWYPHRIYEIRRR